jgi:natural product precursor
MKINKLKINQLSKAELDTRQMNMLHGGEACGCACYYEGSEGGSSSYWNMSANSIQGIDSSIACWKYFGSSSNYSTCIGCNF